MQLKIGILGPGRIGAALAKMWCHTGHDLVVGGSRSPEKSRAVAQWIGGSAKAASNADVAEVSEVILLAVPWWGIPELLQSVGDLSSKLLIDSMNPYAPGFAGRDPNLPKSATAVEALANWLPRARVVKAFNTIPDAALTSELHHRGIAEGLGLRQPDGNKLPDDAPAPGEWPCIIAGDDDGAVEIVETLALEIGFIPVRAGGLSRAILFELGGPLYGQRLRADAIRKRLSELSP
jgi:predicted dinucleotide-binding enzyme